jgi:hypothetical protein
VRVQRANADLERASLTQQGVKLCQVLPTSSACGECDRAAPRA